MNIPDGNRHLKFIQTTERQDKVIPIEIQDEVLIPIETKFIPIETKLIPIETKKKFSVQLNFTTQV